MEFGNGSQHYNLCKKRQIYFSVDTWNLSKLSNTSSKKETPQHFFTLKESQFKIVYWENLKVKANLIVRIIYNSFKNS